MDQLNGRLQILRNEMFYRRYIILPRIITGLEKYEKDETIILKERMVGEGCVFQHLPDENDPEDILKNDGKRHQLIIKQFSRRNKQIEFIKDLSQQVAFIVNKLFPANELKQSPVSVLYSEKGCCFQDPHYDYHPTLNPLVTECFAAILFLEDGGKLVVQHGSKLIDQQFNQGDLIIFRGDLAHAGSAYMESDNTRLHYYFDHIDYTREQDATYTKQVCETIVKEHNSIKARKKRGIE